MQINEAMVNNAHKIVHCELNEPLALKQLIKTLASVLHDTNISFINNYNQTTTMNFPQISTPSGSSTNDDNDISGIEIVNLTETQTMIIYVKIKKNNILNFYCNKPKHDIALNNLCMKLHDFV